MIIYHTCSLTNCSTGIGSARYHRIAIRSNARLAPFHRITSDALTECDIGEEVSQVPIYILVFHLFHTISLDLSHFWKIAFLLFQALIKPYRLLVSLVGCFISCSARIAGDTQTHKHTHTHTRTPSTVTLAAQACRELIEQEDGNQMKRPHPIKIPYPKVNYHTQMKLPTQIPYHSHALSKLNSLN